MPRLTEVDKFWLAWYDALPSKMAGNKNNPNIAKEAKPGRRRPAKRTGLPQYWSREYFELARQGAAEKAELIMQNYEEAGLVEKNPLPETDDAIAKATLKEAVILALHPAIPIKDKLVAINTCLAYTKIKPVTKAEFNVKRPEDWLTEAIEASKDATARD